MFAYSYRAFLVASLFAVAALGCNSDRVEGNNFVDPVALPDGTTDVAPDTRDVGPDGADGTDTCVPRSICDDQACDLPVQVPAPVEQTFQIELTEEPPRAWSGEIEVSTDRGGESAGDAEGSFDLYFHGPTRTSDSDRATVPVFPDDYDLAWPDTSPATPVYGFLGGDLPRRDVSVPSNGPVRVTGHIAEPVSVEGTIRLDGRPADQVEPLGGEENASEIEWELVFDYAPASSPPGSDAEVVRRSGTLDEPTFEAALPPIAYDIYLDIHHEDFGDGQNPYLVGGEKLVAEEFEPGDENLDVSLETARLEGNVSVKGANCSGEEATDDPCNLVFVDLETAEQFKHSIAPGDTYRTRIHPGTYDVFLRAPGGDTSPRPVAEEVTIDGERRLDISSELVDLELTPEWDDEPAAEKLPEGKSGELILQAPYPGRYYRRRYTEEFGEEQGDTVTMSVPPGTYELRGDLPIDALGEVRLERQLQVPAESETVQRDAEFRTVEVPVDGTVGGTKLAEVTPSKESSPEIMVYPTYIDDDDPSYVHDDALSVEASELQDGEVTIYKGRYDVELRRDYANYREESGPGGGGATERIFYTTDTLPITRDWSPGAGSGLEVDLATVSLEGRTRLGDEPLVEETSPGISGWHLTFEHHTTGESFSRVFEVNSAAWETDMNTGVYDVYFGFHGTNLPDSLANVSVEVAECVEIR